VATRSTALGLGGAKVVTVAPETLSCCYEARYVADHDGKAEMLTQSIPACCVLERICCVVDAFMAVCCAEGEVLWTTSIGVSSVA